MWYEGEFTGDGTVDINDLTIVLANYGHTSIGSASWPPCPSRGAGDAGRGAGRPARLDATDKEVRTAELISVAFRSAKVACFRGAKGDIH